MNSVVPGLTPHPGSYDCLKRSKGAFMLEVGLFTFCCIIDPTAVRHYPPMIRGIFLKRMTPNRPSDHGSVGFTYQYKCSTHSCR